MTTYVPIRLTLELTLETGIHIGTGFGLAKLLDARTTRGPHAVETMDANLPYIPGASLKGRLRVQAETLAATLKLTDQQMLCSDLFGTEQQGGRLIFPDVHLIDATIIAQQVNRHPGGLIPYLALEERAHVALSRKRRAAREQMLMRIETASPGLRLQTTVRGWLPQPIERARRGLALLVLAARATTHVGGHKGRGLGAVRIAISHIELDGQPLTLTELGEALR